MVKREELAQALSQNGVEPPVMFMQNGTVQPEEAIKGCLPQIDISVLTSPCISMAKDEAMKLHEAFSTFGCCLVVNHGMSREFMDTVRGIANDFFKLPLEEKSKYARPDDTWQGYGFDKRPEDYGNQDWTDRLMFKLGPEAQRNFNYWPKESPSNFREVMKECNTKVDKLLVEVLKGMARSLELEEESFVDEIGEPRWIARLSLYPKCLQASKVLGLDAHTDGTVLTFVLLDREVGGAQLCMDGRWVEIPFESEDAILVNLGDQGEVIISNGEFKAPIHRVTVNPDKERQSVAFFCLSEKGKVVGPVKGLVNGTTKPAKYKKVTNYERIHGQNPKHRAMVESMKL
ncbi:2-oxoglutarate-dependent dioxygenase 11 [Linum perenne]